MPDAVTPAPTEPGNLFDRDAGMSDPAHIRFEVCADSPASAYAALQGGADRIELCHDLSVGGVTPPMAVLEQVLEMLAEGALPVHVLIRPRAGNFCYEETEVREMERAIRICRELGAAGIVTGGLRVVLTRYELDLPLIKRLREACGPLPMTFHRAFDALTPMKQIEALERLEGLGVGRILTSGGAPTALEGAEQLRRLVDEAGGRLAIMPGGGVTESNLKELHRAVGAREYHGSLRNPTGFTDMRQVRAVKRLLANLSSSPPPGST
jgi:copper homeostasis protein